MTTTSPRIPRVVLGAALLVLWVALLTFSEPAVGRNLDLDWSLAAGWFMWTRAQAGVDYVFTYGPLGHFGVAPYFPGLYWARFTWSIAFAGVSAVALTRFATVLPSRGWQLVWLWLCLGILPGAQVLYFVVLVVAALLHVAEDGWSPARLALTGALFATIGLVKFTFLTVAAGLVALLCFACPSRMRQRASAVLCTSFLLALGVEWSLAGQSLVNFPAYLSASYEVARGYSDAMSAIDAPKALEAAYEAAALLGVGTVLSPRAVWTSRRFFGVLVIALGSFVTWKEGVVRADPGHLVVILGYGALAPAMLAAVSRGEDTDLRPLRSAFLGLAVLVCLAAIRSLHGETPLRTASLARSREAGAHSLDILLHPNAHLEDCKRLWWAQRDRFILPEIRARVGRSTLDTATVDQSVVLYNDFNWKPRPAYQSFSAWTLELARRNGEFFRRLDAPRFVLFRWGSIDRRFPADDDPAALLEILRRYHPVLRERDYILMERRSPAEIREAPVLQSTRRHLRFGTWLHEEFDESSFYTLSVTTHPTFLGTLKKFFLRGPRLIFSVQQAAGERKRYELVPELASTPFALSPLFEGNFDIGYYYSGSGRWITGIGFARVDDAEEFFGDGVDVQIDRYRRIAEPNADTP